MALFSFCGEWLFVLRELCKLGCLIHVDEQLRGLRKRREIAEGKFLHLRVSKQPIHF